jgi:hypothetical protein
VRTTTAFATEPFFTLLSGNASFTLTTTMSLSLHTACETAEHLNNCTFLRLNSLLAHTPQLNHLLSLQSRYSITTHRFSLLRALFPLFHHISDIAFILLVVRLEFCDPLHRFQTDAESLVTATTTVFPSCC